MMMVVTLIEGFRLNILQTESANSTDQFSSTSTSTTNNYNSSTFLNPPTFREEPSSASITDLDFPFEHSTFKKASCIFLSSFMSKFMYY